MKYIVGSSTWPLVTVILFANESSIDSRNWYGNLAAFLCILSSTWNDFSLDFTVARQQAAQSKIKVSKKSSGKMQLDEVGKWEVANKAEIQFCIWRLWLLFTMNSK